MFNSNFIFDTSHSGKRRGVRVGELVVGQAGVFDHGVKDGRLVFEQILGRVKLGDLALVHHHDAVVIQDGVQPGTNV